MFKGERSPGELNGFLDAGSHIQGDLVFEDTFRVDGKLTGTVRSDGDLVVGESGEVEAVVEVGRLFVSGTLRGEIRATRRVELASSARVEASLTSPTLVIEEGAKMDGRCVTGGGTGSDKPGPGQEKQAGRRSDPGSKRQEAKASKASAASGDEPSDKKAPESKSSGKKPAAKS